MADALATFAATATPSDAPRLYLVGGMEELGPESARHHEALGRTLAAWLRPQDYLVAIGPHAGIVARAASPGKSATSRAPGAAGGAPPPARAR
ncbi:MAG: UDP-N-acetylmuramoyl-tripeptide--D-alanyl-D-alanine ligase, partial [Opitutaceae bacterium]|nr:UDP-N-acetylmuramoyl-tripeptide--D-alanyl-D-alanine ligase [Opitutaceae bacterium]